jgi:hypothetical protein
MLIKIKYGPNAASQNHQAVFELFYMKMQTTFYYILPILFNYR